MSRVIEEIPEGLSPAATAALAWVNAARDANFKLTGVVLEDEAVPEIGPEPVELGLVLCEDDICMREQVRISAAGDGFSVAAVDAETPLIPPLLDPPVGVRETWLDQQLEKYAFVVLLYYRGLW